MKVVGSTHGLEVVWSPLYHGSRSCSSPCLLLLSGLLSDIGSEFVLKARVTENKLAAYIAQKAAREQEAGAAAGPTAMIEGDEAEYEEEAAPLSMEDRMAAALVKALEAVSAGERPDRRVTRVPNVYAEQDGTVEEYAQVQACLRPGTTETRLRCF